MKIFSLIFLLAFSLTTFAQKEDVSLYKVSYLFKHMPDTMVPNFIREENMVLHIGKDVNEYFSLDQYRKDSIQKKQLEEGAGMVINTAGKKTTATKIFDLKADKKIIVSEMLIKNYIYDDAYPKIEWKILNEVKDFGNVKCTKAEGYFKGRTYTAWFTTELPVSGGPWKLLGLPGLVLEAYDSKMQVQFILTGLEANNQANVKINSEPAKAIKTTKADFAQMKVAAQNDPVGFINAASSEVGSGLKMAPSSGGNFKPKKVPNPIELTED